MQHRRVVRRVDARVRRVHPERLEPGQRSPNAHVQLVLERAGVSGHPVRDASFPPHPQGRVVLGVDQRRHIHGRLSNSKTPLEN